MLSAAIQILAFALALLGVLGTTVATLLPNWKVSINAWSSIMTPISQMQGLWMDCVWYSSGVFSCTMKNSVLSLPAYLQTMRAAMVLSCMVALFGLCLASLGLKCTRWGGSHRAKGHTAIAAGGCFVLASFLCLVPASWFTNEVITTFLTTDLPDSRRPDYPSPAEPDRLLMYREEQRRRELQTEHVPPKNQQNKVVKLQMDKVKQEKPPQEKPGQDHGQKLYSSPSKLPPKDIKDSYSLQEYV
ncbi:Claudin-20 [Larimichthys crocea]|uniref:Claudin n=1 Tax=Larimichthys crocea TaxID=215358 RepID=A0A6G0I4W3_LARCR|nr:Claudin-20 [Larimichthys crocea]